MPTDAIFDLTPLSPLHIVNAVQNETSARKVLYETGKNDSTAKRYQHNDSNIDDKKSDRALHAGTSLQTETRKRFAVV